MKSKGKKKSVERRKVSQGEGLFIVYNHPLINQLKNKAKEKFNIINKRSHHLRGLLFRKR